MPIGVGGFLVTATRSQGVGNQTPCGRLGLRITGSECQRLVPDAVGLAVVTCGVANAAELNPQKRVVRFDAHGTLDRGGRQSEVSAGQLFVCLRDERG